MAPIASVRQGLSASAAAFVTVLWWLAIACEPAAAINGTFSAVPTWPGPTILYSPGGSNDGSIILYASRIDVTFFPGSSMANVSFSILELVKNAYRYYVRVDMNMSFAFTGLGEPTSISFAVSGQESDCYQNTTGYGSLCDFLPLTVTGAFDVKQTTSNNQTTGLLIGRNSLNIPWGYVSDTLMLRCSSPNCGTIAVENFSDLAVTSINGIKGPVRRFRRVTIN